MKKICISALLLALPMSAMSAVTYDSFKLGNGNTYWCGRPPAGVNGTNINIKNGRKIQSLFGPSWTCNNNEWTKGATVWCPGTKVKELIKGAEYSVYSDSNGITVKKKMVYGTTSESEDEAWVGGCLKATEVPQQTATPAAQPAQQVAQTATPAAKPAAQAAQQPVQTAVSVDVQSKVTVTAGSGASVVSGGMRTISGTVFCQGMSDAMEACIGAAVTCDKTITTGMAVGLDGAFELKCPANEGIVASFVGMKDATYSATQLSANSTGLRIELGGSTQVETVVVKSCHDDARGIRGGTLVNDKCIPSACHTPRWVLNGTGNSATCVEQACAGEWKQAAGGAWSCMDGNQECTSEQLQAFPDVDQSKIVHALVADSEKRVMKNTQGKDLCYVYLCKTGFMVKDGKCVVDDVLARQNACLGAQAAYKTTWVNGQCICPADAQGRPQIFNYDSSKCELTAGALECSKILNAKWNVVLSRCECVESGYEIVNGVCSEGASARAARLAAEKAKIKAAHDAINALSESKKTVWRNEDGKFNTARLASDSVAGVVLGATGALVTNKLVKDKHVEDGFEDLNCVIGNDVVAGWGDQIVVGAK